MKPITRRSLFAFGILLVTLAAASYAEAPQAGPPSVAQGPAVQPMASILTPEGTCQATEDTSSLTSSLELFAPTPQAGGLCGAGCRASCRDECWQMGRTCKPDCVPTICECFCNC